nr:hypothetical protein [Tanacetum cinerariifolium]
MDTTAIPVSAKENLRNSIDIKMDIIHPEPVAGVAFPAAVELTALRFKVDIAEVENASLRARIKTTEAIKKITRKRESEARVEIEQQLAAVQESQHQDRENFMKLKELVMDTTAIPVSAKENLRNSIDIKMDIIHPEPVAAVAFPAAVELTALRFKVDIAEVENASLRARIKPTEAIKKITRKREREARVEIEQQLAAVQESQHQDRENFMKLKELVTSQFG